MKFIIPFFVALLPAAAVAQSPSAQAPGTPAAMQTRMQPRTTAMMVMVSPRQGVALKQIMAVMPSEIRETVKLYLDGKISQWYSRGDGKGVIFLINATTENEAKAIMETLPLSQQQLVDDEYIPLGPLMPLMGLISPGAKQ